MAVQNYEPEEERDTRSIRSGLSRHSSVVMKQNKENQEQVRRPLGVRMGTRAVFESRESLVTAELTAPNSPEPTIPEAYILSEYTWLIFLTLDFFYQPDHLENIFPFDLFPQLSLQNVVNIDYTIANFATLNKFGNRYVFLSKNVVCKFNLNHILVIIHISLLKTMCNKFLFLVTLKNFQ